MNNSSGYFIDEDESGLGKCLVLTGPWRTEFAIVARDEEVKVLRLSRAAGWKDTDLNFVRDLKFLEGVEIFSFDVKDVAPVFELKGLRYVGFQCNFNSATRFEAFENLESCKIFWGAKALDLWTCIKLRHLNIVNYPNANLAACKMLRRMCRLQISSRKLTTLQGIECMGHLQIFDAADCQKLADLSTLVQCRCLESIRIKGCRRIAKIPERLGDTELKSVVLEDCGKIESLAPLANVRGLQSIKFVGDTTVLDGDLAFFEEIPALEEVWFANRRHYSVTREELALRLAAKHQS